MARRECTPTERSSYVFLSTCYAVTTSTRIKSVTKKVQERTFAASDVAVTPLLRLVDELNTFEERDGELERDSTVLALALMHHLRKEPFTSFKMITQSPHSFIVKTLRGSPRILPPTRRLPKTSTFVQNVAKAMPHFQVRFTTICGITFATLCVVKDKTTLKRGRLLSPYFNPTRRRNDAQKHGAIRALLPNAYIVLTSPHVETD